MTYESMLAETVAFRGHNGDVGEAYYARPLGGGPWPGVVLIHHMPGWDEWIKEATRKLAHHDWRRSRRTSISAKAPAAPTTSGPACARPAASPTSRCWATSRALWSFCAHNPMPTAESA